MIVKAEGVRGRTVTNENLAEASFETLEQALTGTLDRAIRLVINRVRFEKEGIS